MSSWQSVGIARDRAPLRASPAVPSRSLFWIASPRASNSFDGTEPSGCSFWRLAAEGRVFYTLPVRSLQLRRGQPTR